MHRLNRRRFLQLGGMAAAAAALPLALHQHGSARAQERPDSQRFLFIVCAFGGASIIDSFLPMAASQVTAAGGDAEALIAYPDQLVVRPAGATLRGIGSLGDTGLFRTTFEIETFLQRHHKQMAVVPITHTSVNHVVAQKRAITGAGVDRGRTIMELMASQHGQHMPLPNCNMAAGGYIEPGEDASLDGRFRAEIIAQPTLFAASTHGHQGVIGAPRAELIARARAVREAIDDLSHFGTTFQASPRRRRYLTLRREALARMEQSALIERLMLLPDDANTPLSQYGLKALPAAERERLLDHFPRMLTDPLEGQAALAFLLARYQVSCAVAMGPSFQPTILDSILDTPLAFDYSHTDHVVAQHVMWGRILRATDGLIDLLKGQPYDEAKPERGTLWDRSVVAIVTDFGRDKQRPRGATQFGTGHHLNNGSVLISPLIKGDRAWGGVDPTTLETFGDAGDGVRTTWREGHLYSAIAHALGLEFDGRLDMSFVKA